MFHIDIVQTAVRDSKGRFTGEYRIEFSSFLLTRIFGGDTIPSNRGLLKAQIVLCPLILWLTYSITGG
jgi:hypothetical protein